jgi:hypothetical protein
MGMTSYRDDAADLRRVFDDLAADPPLALGRKEAVMSRVSRRLQRQAAVRGADVLVLAGLLGMGAVQTTLHLQQTGSDGEATVITSSTPTPSHEPTHEPSHEPSHAPSTEPTHAVSVEPTHGTSTEPSHEPTHAPAVEPTHSAPTPEDTTASGPLAVSVEMSPSTVDTSTDTRALVTARDGEGRLLAVDIDWGDGKTFHFAPGDTPCPRTTHLDGSFNHRYSTPGSYAVHVTVTSGDCAPTEKVTREAHVTVTGTEPSPTETNGPASPTATAGTRTGDNPAYVYITAAGADSDGWISRIVVHWGDGAESAYPYSTSGCTDADGTNHPVSNQQSSSVPGGHHYASPGQYTVTVTVTSVACDGTHAQTGSTTMAVTSP